MPSFSNTDFFQYQEDVIPDFAHYYTSFGDPNTWTSDGSLANILTKSSIINGKPSIIFTIFKGQDINGVPSSASVPAVEIILQKQDDGKFVDVTKELLGSSVGKNGFQLNSAPAQILVTNVDGVLNPLIVIAQNCDDGRDNGTNFASNLAVSQIQIPKSDGTYKTQNLGKPAFGDEGSLYLTKSALGLNIYLSGYQADDSFVQVTSPEGTSIFLQKNQVFLFKPEDSSITQLDPSIGNQAGSVVLSSGIIATQFDDWSGGSRDTSVGLIEKNEKQDWIISQTIKIFDYKTISNYKTWGGATGSIQVIDVGGQQVAGIFRVIDSIYEPINDKTYVMTAVTGQKLSSVHVDGYYYESDYSPFAAFQFWDYVDGRLVQSALHLVNPNTDVNIGGIQQIDVDHNGLTDLVINNWNFTGQPDVYLNDGAGDLYHVPLSEFPVFDPDYVANAIFVDLGDQTWGLLYKKEGVNKFNYMNATPEIYYSTKAITILEDVEIHDRNKGVLITTWAGNDTILDKNANSETSIDAGSGLDTVIYSGQLKGYKFFYDSQSLFHVEQDSEQSLPTVSDTLKNIERLKFSDVNLALDIDGNAGAAYRLYKAAFDRTPDLGGLGYWIAQLDKGGKLSDAATYFTISPEFQSLYGSQTSDSQFVNLLYQHVLHRAAEGEGYNFWVNALSPNGGWSRGGVLEFFSQSPENQGQTAELVANGIQYQEWLG